MRQVTLHIETPDGNKRTVRLEAEITIGRTNAAQIVLNDSMLSRVHATVFREGEDVWIADENSSNGTFVNGERVSPERKIKDGDEISLGGSTHVYVEISDAQSKNESSRQEAFAAPILPPANYVANNSLPDSQSAITNPQPKGIPLIPLAAAAFVFFIVVFAGVAVFLTRSSSDSKKQAGGTAGKPNLPVSTALVPVRVIDPLGGEDPDDLEDFISSWEGEEEELKAENIEEIKTVPASGGSGTVKQSSDLIVSVDFWKKQRDLALNHSGASEPLRPPPEMSGRGFVKQIAKTGELINTGKYKQPLDFADLAELYLKGTLVELPIATESYVLDVGGSATDGPFTEFDFDKGNLPIAPGSEKYNNLKKLADFLKYDLETPTHRKQMRMRLLRMYNASSRKIFEEICRAYYDRFKVPLRVTSLTRSMDYQISLNATNGNSYRVRGKGSLPPHTSGCAFDMSRKNLSPAEQNFMMAKLAEYEIGGKLDSLMEGNANACFHTFIYPDGAPPK